MGVYKLCEDLPDGWMIYIEGRELLYYLSPDGNKFQNEEEVHQFLEEEFDVNYGQHENVSNNNKSKSSKKNSKEIKVCQKQLSKMKPKRVSLRQKTMNLFLAQRIRSEIMEQKRNNNQVIRERCCQFTENGHEKMNHLINYVRKDL